MSHRTEPGPSHTLNPERSSHKGLKVVVGTVVGSLITAGSGVMPANAEVFHKNNKDKTEQSVPNPKERYQYLDGYNPEKDVTIGDIRPARIYKKEFKRGKYSTFTRPNGEIVNVAHIRDKGDPTSTAESFIGLWAAYLTTGDENVLGAITAEEELKAKITGDREFLDIDFFQKEINPNIQTAVYDLPDDPAVFVEVETSDGQRLISLERGTLYLHHLYGTQNVERGDTTWQGPSTHAGPADAVFSQFDFVIRKGADGESSVVSLIWDSTPNPNL